MPARAVTGTTAASTTTSTPFHKRMLLLDAGILQMTRVYSVMSLRHTGTPQ